MSKFSLDKTGAAYENTKNGEFHVFVSGAVKNPGIVTSKKEITFFEAASLCGFSENAYIENSLKTKIAKDGDEVYIMTFEEHETLVSSPKININTASADEFNTLPGIGESLSQRIVKFRAENGKFYSEKELMLVPGIAESKYNDIKLFITVRQED